MQDPISLLRFVAGHYAFVILVGFVGYLLGLRFTKRLNYDSLLEKVSVCSSLGLGAIAYLIFLLGVLGLLYEWVVIIVLVACVAGTYPIPLQVAQEIVSAVRCATLRARALLAGAGLVMSAPLLVLPLYPPTQFDATFFFLASAKIYVQKHGVVFLPYHRPPVITQLNEMLFTLSLLLYDDIAAQLMQLLMLTLLTLAVMAFCRRNFSNQAGWWSAALLLASPAVVWCGTVAYLDISLTLFSAMAGYTFWNWFHSREGAWLILSGAFCGFAASTKYPGLFFPLFFGLVTVYIAIRERKYLIPLRLGAAAFVTGGPWYIRNFYYTRNPVFPFFPQIFGYSWWNAADVEGLIEDLRLYGVGRSVSALLLLPWSLAFNQDVFFSEGHHITRLFFFALPLIVVFVIKDARFRKMAGFLLAFMIFWAFSSQILRYLLPAIPVLSIASAASFDLLLGWIPFVRDWRSHWIVVAMIFVVLVYGGWTYSLSVWEANGPIPVSQEQRDRYFTQRLPSYPAYKLMNSIKSGNYTLYALQDENMAYFVDGAYKGDYFGPARYARIWDKLTDGRLLYNELKSMGADYFLVNNQRMKITLPQDDFFRSHFKLIYEGGTVRLFELTELPFEPRVKNMLRDPDFEDLKNGRPEGLHLAGSPVVDGSGKYSFSGSVAVNSTRAGDHLYQGLPGDGGGHYFFGGEERAGERGQRAKPQVNWYDAEGLLVRENFKIIQPGSEGNRFEISFEAPPRAAGAISLARVIPVLSGDNFSFGEVKYEPRP